MCILLCGASGLVYLRLALFLILEFQPNLVKDLDDSRHPGQKHDLHNCANQRQEQRVQGRAFSARAQADGHVHPLRCNPVEDPNNDRGDPKYLRS